MSRWQLFCYHHWNEEQILTIFPTDLHSHIRSNINGSVFAELRSSCGKNGLLNVDFNVKRQPFVSQGNKLKVSTEIHSNKYFVNHDESVPCFTQICRINRVT